MLNVVGIQFKKAGKMYYFEDNQIQFKVGEKAIVETSAGMEMGKIVLANKAIENPEGLHIKKIIRKANQQDMETVAANKKKEIEALEICAQKVKEHRLNMKLINVEYSFDRSKILFYFTADGRVDFRKLVKDLASVFKTRIELRQIGVRDESKLMGSLGVCGRDLCCSSFMGEFVPVSIKMAKEQCLSLNPAKISGSCGRLMCCLKYEHETYEELLALTPSEGSLVMTPKGKGVVHHVSLIKGMLKVRLDSGDQNVLEEFSVANVKVLKRAEVKNDIDNFEYLKRLE